MSRNIQLEDGFTPLLKAAVDNKTSDIKLLAQEGDPSLSRIVKENGEWYKYNAIHICAYHDNSVALQAICEAKHQNLNGAIDAYIERKSGDYPGYTPLLIAARHEHREIVKLLVRNGADPSLCRKSYNSSEGDWYGYNAIHICAYNNDGISLQNICEAKHQNLGEAINAHIHRYSGKYSGSTPLVMALRFQYSNIAGILIQNGADPSLCRISYDGSEPDWYAYNAIHICVYHNDEISLKAICEAKHSNFKKAINAHINRKGGDFPTYTPLLISINEGYKNLTKILIRHGADPSLSESSKGFNAIHMCVHKNDEESLRIICNAHPENLYEAIIAKNNEDMSPIAMSAVRGYTKITKLLESTLQEIIHELRQPKKEKYPIPSFPVPLDTPSPAPGEIKSKEVNRDEPPDAPPLENFPRIPTAELTVGTTVINPLSSTPPMEPRIDAPPLDIAPTGSDLMREILARGKNLRKSTQTPAPLPTSNIAGSIAKTASQRRTAIVGEEEEWDTQDDDNDNGSKKNIPEAKGKTDTTKSIQKSDARAKLPVIPKMQTIMPPPRPNISSSSSSRMTVSSSSSSTFSSTTPR